MIGKSQATKRTKSILSRKIFKTFTTIRKKNNELVTKEGSPLIEIIHFNDENEIKKRETYTLGHFLEEAKELKKINYS